jgi:pimeloyl-ACP methyl ester carboxylesterase
MEDMVAIQPLLDAQSNCLMVHLAAHGRSSGHHRPLEPGDWFSAIDSLLAAEGLTFDGTLIGYSLGGRVALSWWAQEPERFSRVVLMAPDGLVKNPGYRFAVDTVLGRAWLGQSERQRERIVRHLGWLRRRGLLPEHFYQFSLFHLETAEMWQMVINCWLSLRRFWPPGRRALKRLAAAHPGVLEAHFGERDKVIPPRNARGLDGVCPVHFHPCGHGLIRPDIVERIAAPSSKS